MWNYQRVQYMLGKFSRTLSPDVTSHLNGTIETQLWNRTAGRVPEFQGSVPFRFSGWATTGGTTPSARDGFNPTDTGAGNVSYLAWMILTSRWLVGGVITYFKGSHSHHMFFLWCHPCYSDQVAPRQQRKPSSSTRVRRCSARRPGGAKLTWEQCAQNE